MTADAQRSNRGAFGASIARRTRLSGLSRYGQVNFTEDDVRLLDVDDWRELWGRARTQVVLLNCGGILAYYPSTLAGHPWAAGIESRDLFGELTAAARDDGLEVLGRLDLAVVDEQFHRLHPEWSMRKADGSPLTLADANGWPRSVIGADLYYTCVNSGLFEEYLPAMLDEIVSRYDVAGFFTNGFPTFALSAPTMRLVCHCDRCLEQWRAFSGEDAFPVHDNPRDPAFRQVVRFVQTTHLDRVRAINQFLDRLRPGLVFNTSTVPGANNALPWDEWVAQADMLSCDNQDRAVSHSRATPAVGLWEVGMSSELLQSVAAGKPVLRVHSAARIRSGVAGRHSSKNAAELRLQMALALAHGEMPMWHAVSGHSYSRRWRPGVAEFGSWLAEQPEELFEKASVADVGLLWNPASAWLEQWGASSLRPFGAALSGWYLAMSRRRIPFRLVRADEAAAFEGLRAVVLPTGLAVSDGAVERLREFAASGGGVVVVGDAGMVDDWGEPRDDDPIGALAGVVRRPGRASMGDPVGYFRMDDDPLVAALLPDAAGDEVIGSGHRITPFETDRRTAMRWNRREQMIPTSAAGLPAPSALPVLAWTDGQHRSAFLGADLDVRYYEDRVPDHRDLVAGLAAWAAGDAPLRCTVDGHGAVDVRCWQSRSGFELLLVNLDSPGAIEEAVEAHTPIGPLRITLSEVPEVERIELRRALAESEIVDRSTTSITFVVPKLVDFEYIRIITAPPAAPAPAGQPHHQTH